MARVSFRLTIIVMAVAAMIGCDEMTSPSEPTDKTDVPQADGYAGNYGATAGRTEVNLEVAEDVFTAVTFTAPRQAATVQATTLRRANANADGGEDAVWVIFTGDVSIAGSTVTVIITGVERDGHKLEGDELEDYTGCAITATAGDTFDDELMDRILECLGTTDEVTVVREQDARALLEGTWAATDHDGGFSGRAGAALSWSIESTSMTFTATRAGDSAPPGVLRMDVVISSTRIDVMAIHNRTCTSPPVGPGEEPPAAEDYECTFVSDEGDGSLIMQLFYTVQGEGRMTLQSVRIDGEKVGSSPLIWRRSS